jgi:hypothetical protein
VWKIAVRPRMPEAAQARCRNCPAFPIGSPSRSATWSEPMISAPETAGQGPRLG